MQRLVTSLPLDNLWNEFGLVESTLIRDLSATEIRELLRVGPVQFVVADVAAPLQWVPLAECFRFWKAEAQSRVAGQAGARLEDFPGEYCYFASEWQAVDGPPVVVLAVAH